MSPLDNTPYGIYSPLDSPEILQPHTSNDSESSTTADTSSVDSLKCLQYLERITEKNPSILLELDLHGNIRYVSQIWESVVGTMCEEVLGSPISDLIVGTEHDKLAFQRAASIMCEHDRSYRVRFLTYTQVGKKGESFEEDSFDEVGHDRELIELEAQGIVIYSKNSSNVPTHTMWVVKPFCSVVEFEGLPLEFVKRLGFGAKLFSSYLQQIKNMGVLDEQDLPSPQCELCRVCETLVPEWWLETHSEMCVCEHRIESTVQLVHDELVELKRLIDGIADSLANFDSQITNYKGLPLPIFEDNLSNRATSTANPNENSELSKVPDTSKIDPFRLIGSDSRNLNPVFKYVQYPFKTLNLLTELCEDAININTSELQGIDSQMLDSQYELFNMKSISYRFSPNSKSNIDHILGWDTNIEESDPALNLLIHDTIDLVRRKVDSVLRLDNAMSYSLKIKNELDEQVLQLIRDTLQSNKINIQNYESTPGTEQKPFFGPFTSTNQSQSIYTDLTSQSSACIATPLSPRPSTIIISDEYADEENSPGIKSITSIDIPTLGYESRSVTSKTCINDPPSNGTYQLPIVGKTPNALGPSIELCSNTLGTSLMAAGNPVILSKQNTVINLTPRRESPLSSGGMKTPISSIQRNPLTKNTEKSPVMSPFTVGTDFFSPESQLPYGNAPKPPLSPLLLATNQAKSSTPSIKDYNIIKPISKGAYGSVYLASKKITGEYLAIKVLRKSHMIAKNQVTNVKSERVIMIVQSEKSYVAKLHATFQNKEYLFLVMEYLSGGDLATLIRLMGSLPDKWVKQYITEVIVGVEDMHLSGIIHHDLKPENLLIDSNGHVKLTDFGLSRMGLIRRHKKQVISQSPLHNAFSHSRKNSLCLDEGINHASGSSGNNITQYDVLDCPIVGRRLERSDSVFSAHSQLEAQALHRTGSQVSFSLMDISRSGTPPILQHLQPQQHQSQQQSQMTLNTQQAQVQNFLSIAPSSGGTILKRSSSVLSSDTSDTSRDLALFHPDEESSKKFFGTPDYLSPETILGTGEGDVSDWWSVGCILFELLLGYPPFHSSTVEDIFKNIFSGKIGWPEFPDKETERECISEEAKDLITKLLTLDPEKRLGADGAQKIKDHPYFKGIDWDRVYENEVSFVPTLEHPEDTDYFDLRGADLDDFVQDNYGEEIPSENILNTPKLYMGTDKKHSSKNSSGNSTPLQKMTVSSVFDTLSQDISNSNSSTTKHISLAIPPRLRERRPSKLNDLQTEFGSFSYRNLSALDRANKDIINRLKSEHYPDNLHSRASPGSISSSSSETSAKLKATTNTGFSTLSPIGSMSANGKVQHLRSGSPIIRNGLELSGPNSFSFTTHKSHNYDQHSLSDCESQSSQSPLIIKFKSPLSPTQSFTTYCSRMNPQTSSHRASISELSMDEEERQTLLSRTSLRKFRKRSGQNTLPGLSDISCNLDVLLCEPIQIHRYRLTKDLETLGCSVVAVGAGDEIVSRAASGVKFDLIITTLKLPKVHSIDIVKLLRHTTNLNSNTPIVAVTVNYHDAGNVFDDVLERPIGMEQLRNLISKFALYKSQQNESNIVSDIEI